MGEVKSLLGVALRAQGRDAEADALIAEGLAVVRDHLGPDAPETRRAAARLR